ncbi:hypothetical protein V1687_17095 [Pseudomonas putida]|uniref:hypothetical protein n=1 Tax=Pseudomonas putida TaxID=303 RepID=UPI002ED39EA7|nr:hypothetical protein V1687_17095 [Pseudomonas putida]
MIKIDWRMAPEWADGHGLISWQGFTEVWISADQYAVVGREGGPYPWGGGTGDTRHNHTRGQVEYITPRPDRWDGEGLPPVGTLVEASFACEDFEDWHDGVCVAVGEDPEGREDFCVVQCGKKIAMYRDEAKRVRPRRTPEQIAAELRKAEITAMADDIAAYADHSDPGEKHFRLATFLIDHGYRKQEAS